MVHGAKEWHALLTQLVAPGLPPGLLLRGLVADTLLSAYVLDPGTAMAAVAGPGAAAASSAAAAVGGASLAATAEAHRVPSGAALLMFAAVAGDAGGAGSAGRRAAAVKEGTPAAVVAVAAGQMYLLHATLQRQLQAVSAATGVLLRDTELPLQVGRTGICLWGEKLAAEQMLLPGVKTSTVVDAFCSV